MKKILLSLVALVCAVVMVKAEVTFAYEAGAELHSTYIWRGTYIGGLSLQPSVSVGYEGEHTMFDFNVWGNVGASNWFFDKSTKLVPEIDITATFTVHHLNVGFIHYYYCDGSNFFSWQEINKVYQEDNSSSTEVFVGFNFKEFNDKAGAYINWYTTVAGRDGRKLDDGTVKRAYSSYLELGYEIEFERIGMSFDANIAFSPWASEDIYGNEKFAVQCLSLRVEKEWAWDACSLTLFAQGMMNPSAMNKDNVFIKKGGDKTEQTLNGTIGLGIWF